MGMRGLRLSIEGRILSGGTISTRWSRTGLKGRFSAAPFWHRRS